jgi:UPF0716 protein FxsA
VSVALVLAFLVVPVLEIYVIVQVGQAIGGWQTAGLLLFESLLGAWIVKREGRRAWRALRDSIGAGAMPSRQLTDAALVLVGGTLLVTPGFLSDVVGFFLVLPITRPLARRVVAWFLARRVEAAVRGMAMGPGGGGGAAATGRAFGPAARVPRPGARDRTTRRGSTDRVIQGEVVDDDGDITPGR